MAAMSDPRCFDLKRTHDDGVSECGTTRATRRRTASIACDGGDAPEDAWEAASESASEVTCVGCLLPSAAMIVLDEFVHRNAARLSDWALWSAASLVYDRILRPVWRLSDGREAPVWSPDEIRAHYAHGVHPRLEAVRICRELSALRRTVAAQLERETSGGAATTAIAQQYSRLVAAEAKQLVAATFHDQPCSRVPPRSTSPRPRAVRTKRTKRPPLKQAWPSVRPLSSLSSGAPSLTGDAAPPSDLAMNESVAKEALKVFLASYVKPCMPKAGGAQPTVEEILRGVDTSEILRRHRSRQLVLFQGRKSGRRCFCGERCSFLVNRAFVEGFADAQPRAAAFFTTEMALVAAVLAILEIPCDPRALRKSGRYCEVFGFRAG